MAKTKTKVKTKEERKQEIIKYRLERVQTGVDDLFYSLGQLYGELTSSINRYNVSDVIKVELERLEDIKPEQAGRRVVLEADAEDLLPDEQGELDYVV